MHSAAWLAVSIWLLFAKVTQLPRDRTLTRRPERPSRRYSIVAMFCLLDSSVVRANDADYAVGLAGTSGQAS